MQFYPRKRIRKFLPSVNWSAVDYEKDGVLGFIGYKVGMATAIVKDNTDKSMTKGKKIESGPEAPIEPSNRLPLSLIPVGSQIYAIEITPGKGAQMVRSAGTKAQLMAKEGDYAQVRLPSGEVRRFRMEATAAIGVVGTVQHQNIKIGSAGRNRRKGIRPGVRGVVMNAADHPHGGGDGGRHGAGKAPRSPWGQLTLGYRTRRRKDVAGLIVKSRHEAKRKR